MMRSKWTTASVFVLLALRAYAGEPQLLGTQRERANYAVGVETARAIKQQGTEIDPDLLMRGVKDVASGEKLLMSEKELRETMNAFQAELRRVQAHTKKLAAVDNRKLGEAFLAENGAREDVVTLASGLQYRIIRAGAGKRPAEDDTVECYYRGTLIDGTEFDGTGPGRPATFKIKGGTIPGLAEALKLMPTGSKWQLFIPPQLAYGARGAGRFVGPNATIIFEVELLAVK